MQQQPSQQQLIEQKKQQLEQLKANLKGHPTLIPNPKMQHDIKGDVRFGKGCIVNQGCSIIAERDAGPIIIGDYNIIEEKVVIHNRTQKDGSVKTLRIGSYNLFEVDAKINSSQIGDYNTFQHNCFVDRNCVISDGCTIGATVKLSGETKLQDKVKVIWPNKTVRDNQFEKESHKQGILALYESHSFIYGQDKKVSFIHQKQQQQEPQQEQSPEQTEQ